MNRGEVHEVKMEKAVLVGMGEGDRVGGNDLSLLDELAELASTAEVVPVARIYQRRQAQDATYFIGSGKVDEVAAVVRETGADVVLFDSELSPRQQRNLEEKVKAKVLDRSEVILDIFATHARTQEAKLQVELAQLRYMRPRLRRMWTHLERITGRGGIGSRGPGEKQIETDRRLIDNRLTALQHEIEEVKSRRRRLVGARDAEFTISLVGYTNAGKSTLMNRLTGAGVLQANVLFSTLDTKTSDFILPSGRRALLSDTVGFIRDLPHHLVASFYATLEEVRQAKLLIHVIDASFPGVERQVETVHSVLESELELRHRNEILVFNKSDAIRDMLEYNVLANRYPDHVRVSALTGEGIDALVHKIDAYNLSTEVQMELIVPAGDGRTLAELESLAQVTSLKYLAENAHVTARVPIEHEHRFLRFRR
jgi:GTPase